MPLQNNDGIASSVKMTFPLGCNSVHFLALWETKTSREPMQILVHGLDVAQRI